MQFFTSPEDLKGWVKSHPTSDDAANKLLDIFKKEEKPSGAENIIETCKEIYKEDENSDASEILFGVLAKHNITQVKSASTIKGVEKMEKEAQSAVQSRQRNNWVRGNRNKFNRVVDGFNEGTPWRVDRDKFYNFTHYYTDDLKFDADPSHVYSGEAIWRMYIMDKFTADYQDEKGRIAGGYINDRFHRFPTAGTPANPDVDRLHGNQMELAPGERSRKPRPHQYSTERRLEEARGGETSDLTAIVANAKTVIKLASAPAPEREADKVYSIFKDTLDMREAGVEYPTMLEAISEHYDTGIMNVAQIDKVAQQIKSKHDGIVYVADGKYAKAVFAQVSGPTFQVGNNIVSAIDNKGQSHTLPSEAVLSQIGSNIIQIIEDKTGTFQPNTKLTLENIESLKESGSLLSIDDGMNELSGETTTPDVFAAPVTATESVGVNETPVADTSMTNFSVDQATPQNQ